MTVPQWARRRSLGWQRGSRVCGDKRTAPLLSHPLIAHIAAHVWFDPFFLTQELFLHCLLAPPLCLAFFTKMSTMPFAMPGGSVCLPCLSWRCLSAFAFWALPFNLAFRHFGLALLFCITCLSFRCALSMSPFVLPRPVCLVFYRCRQCSFVLFLFASPVPRVCVNQLFSTT